MLGIIGGTGLYQLDGLEVTERREVDTPFGRPSAPLTLGKLGGRELAFLPRHGGGHALLPHEINYRANIYALKAAGVTRVLSVSATGSLEADMAPGDLALPTQYLDFTKGKRAHTFFGDGLVAHVSTADPVCPALVEGVLAAGQAVGTALHTGKTYACVEGPRLGTRAESRFLQIAGADLVGMTNVPEVFLAAEAQLCYATIAVVTDYDCWLEDPEQHATADKVMALYRVNVVRIQELLRALAAGPETQTHCRCRSSLGFALVTPEAAWTEAHRQLLAVLRA